MWVIFGLCPFCNLKICTFCFHWFWKVKGDSLKLESIFRAAFGKTRKGPFCSFICLFSIFFLFRLSSYSTALGPINILLDQKQILILQTSRLCCHSIIICPSNFTTSTQTERGCAVMHICLCKLSFMDYSKIRYTATLWISLRILLPLDFLARSGKKVQVLSSKPGPCHCPCCLC